jgi:SAM-dependent methyltransferase
MSPYVCPDCKTALVDLRCSQCGHQYTCSEEFPVLLSNDASLQISRQIAKTYESIYLHRSNVWQDQGRTPEFIQYFANLLARFPARRFLEVGCGEGALLAAVSAREKHGTELSAEALRKTLAKTPAQLCVALGERLPFCDGYFDLIASVGVMEHFLDSGAATREIWRSLKSGGHYIVLIHVHLTTWQSLRQKILEYVYPRPHPVRLMKWIAGKLYQPIHQPIQNNYTTAAAKACLKRSGFTVTEVIDKRKAPAAPLIGPHVTIYVCQKPA